ncbi:sensory box/GGDEF family protein [Roseburia sp. CAG:100]|nr:sensory box/GGDEF family protein [Roseburia sp. CAG:100]
MEAIRPDRNFVVYIPKRRLDLKPHKIIDKIYYIIVISCVLFLAIIFFRDILSENRKISDEGESIMPDKQYQIDADTRKFEFSMQKIDNKERCIKFYTAHMEVRVYADNSLIYTIDSPKPFYEKTPGAVWNFVEIPSDTEKVTVILQAVYPEVRQKAINFYIGNLEQMYNKILYGSGLDIVVSLIEMAIGVILILYWSIAHSRLEIEHTILYFGIFSVMIGIWAFNESGTLMTIIPIRAACVLISAVSLMLMTPAFVRFVKCFWRVPDRWISDVICILAFINIVVQLILQLTGIRGFRQMFTPTHILLGMALMYMAGATVYAMWKRGINQQVIVGILGIIVLLGVLTLDLVHFYLGSFQITFIGNFGVLIYICILVQEAFKQTISQADKARKLEFYRQLATKDMLTDMYNRNSYDEWVKENVQMPGTLIITFDLNNLKYCNDTLGHAIGDDYIKNAAGIIAEIFGNFGNCYRIGGDEFCVVIPKQNKIDPEDKLTQLEQEQKKYNAGLEYPYMQIAYGYAEYDAQTDLDIEDTRSRADEKMYEMKRRMKMENTLKMDAVDSRLPQ